MELVQPWAIEVLAAGPLTLAELTAALRDRGIFESVDEDAWNVEEIVDECLLTDGRVFDFPDGRIALVASVLDGVTLTHRVTAGELERGVLDLHPDLDALMWCADEMPLTGTDGNITTGYPSGGDRRFAEHGSYVGPDGWLAGVDRGHLVALRYRDGAIELLRDVEPAADAAKVAHTLRDVYEAVRAQTSDIEVDLLVLEAAYLDSDIFRSSTLPLGELIPMAGLRLQGVNVGRVGEPARRARRRDGGGGVGGIETLRVRHQLDDCCVTELRRLVDTYLAWVAAGPSGRSEVSAAWRADQLYAAADHGAVAIAFGDFLTATSTGARDAMDGFAGALAAAAGDVLAPFALYVSAVSALTDADAVEALSVLEAMVATGTNFAPAVDLAAVLLADAGRPADALAARRRASSLGWEPADTANLQVLLRQHTKTGRNDPCPCGSGRKYKQCCQREPRFTTADRRRLALHQMVRHAIHGTGRDELWSLAMTAMTEAMAPGEQPADLFGRIVVDPIMIDLATFETGEAADYLRERGAIIPPDERAWLERLTKTPLSLWSCELEPDGSYRTRDVMTGERLEGVRFPDDDGQRTLRFVLARMLADGIDGTPGAIGPSLWVDDTHVPTLIELLDGFGEAHEWARWLGERMGGVDPREGGEPGLNRGFFALPDGGWDTARPVLDLAFTADGAGWIQYLELDEARVVRAALTAEGDELAVATSSLRRLGALRDALEQHGFRMVRSEVPDDDDDDWDGIDDDWASEWDDDEDDGPHDEEALAAALAAVDAMFDRPNAGTQSDEL